MSDEMINNGSKEDFKPVSEQISWVEDDTAVAVGLHTWMAVFAGCMFPFTGFYLVICGASFTGYVVADIGGATGIAWLPNAYELVVLAMAAFMSSMGDVYGRRQILLGGLVLTFIGCILIATAKNINVVIVGSALTGGLFANQGNFYTIPAEVLPKRYRGIGATLGAAAGGLGALAAYLSMGAFIRDYAVVGWRYGFYVSAGFVLLTGIMFYIYYTPINKPSKTFIHVITHDIDMVGTALQLGFAVPFIIGLVWGGNAYPWASAHCIGTLAVGGASLIALIVHQVWFKKDGLFHHELFECRNFAISALGLFIEGICFLVFLLFYPLMIATLYEAEPFNQSLRVLPFWAAFTIACPLVGIYSRRTKDLNIGFGLVLIATIVMATLGPQSANVALGVMIIGGVGFSTPLALFNATAQLAVPKKLLGLASGQFIAARAFGASVGAVIFVAILTTKATTVRSRKLSSWGGLLISTVALKSAYSEAFHYGWYACIPFVAIALLMCVGLDGDAIKKQMNWAVDNPVEEIHHIDEVKQHSHA
ncbi:hypothetical protein RQP46_007715 [Phenoliferia psychrophenolica]